MGKLAEAYVDIKGDDSNLNATLNRSDGALSRFVAGANARLGGIALAAGLATGVAGLAAAFEAVKKAADLGESLDKVKNAFGPSGGAIVKQADELAKKYGIVRREALDAASAFGLMGRAAGLTKEQSAQLGNTFVKLGIDLASFHNLTNAEAFEKLRSGLAGESEPLRPLGILLSEDAVKAEALASGLVKVNRTLTDQEKVLARVSLIQKQMANQGAVGDRERTADSTANQMKKIAGDWENFKTELGKELIPALSESIKLAHELGATFEKTFGAGPVQAFGAELKAMAAAWRVQNDIGWNHTDNEFRAEFNRRDKGLPAATKEEIAAAAAKGKDKNQIKNNFAAQLAPEELKNRVLVNQRLAAEAQANWEKRLNEKAERENRAGLGRPLDIASRLLGPSHGVLGAALGALGPDEAGQTPIGRLKHAFGQIGQDRARQAAMDEAERQDRHRERNRIPAQFTNGEDFWKQLQTSSLNKEGDAAKTQVEKLQENTKKLDEAKQTIGTLIGAIKDMVPRMRGRS